MWEASRACGRRGVWRGRRGLVVKELVHLPGIYRPLNWKVIWSDATLDPLNSRVEDVLKVSDQLRSSCSHPGKRWEGGALKWGGEILSKRISTGFWIQLPTKTSKLYSTILKAVSLFLIQVQILVLNIRSKYLSCGNKQFLPMKSFHPQKAHLKQGNLFYYLFFDHCSSVWTDGNSSS